MPHKPKYSLLHFSVKSFISIYCTVVGLRPKGASFSLAESFNFGSLRPATVKMDTSGHK